MVVVGLKENIVVLVAFTFHVSTDFMLVIQSNLLAGGRNFLSTKIHKQIIKIHIL